MKKTYYRLKDRVEEWLRYPQPSAVQKALLGQYTDVQDYEVTAVRLASEDSARYMLANMRATRNFATDYDLHDWVVGEIDPGLRARGLILEFGVATGRTLNHFARLMPEKTVYGFDGFVGLPEAWTSRMQAGFFARENLPRVRKNCELVVGWFSDTLPGFAKKHQQSLALLHVDCDLYSSTVTILENLEKQIVPGTVIVFDEYINYPGWQLDEFRAWHEFVAKNKIKYEYIGRVSRHQKVAVRVLGNK
jgi:predicted O-methyltransferase YrrM